jgi:UDP-N-acetyl-2-amino-2-deoxyglucuronate dehydrogenase
MNFAITGVAGFVAPRHLKAIKDTNNRLVAALDPHDSVGILDDYFPNTFFFTQTEIFERYLETLQEQASCEDQRIHYMSICVPNYLHDSHIRMALRIGANAICEKPLSIEPNNLHKLMDLGTKVGREIFTILQLRMHPILRELKTQLTANPLQERPRVCLTYVTRRGNWYKASWKASKEKSGGLAMNIGVHFFDILLWLFGPVMTSEVHLSDANRMAGFLELEGASVQWFLSVNETDLPDCVISNQKSSYRSLTLNGENLEFSDGFTNLHTRVYEEILLGRGFSISEAIPSLELVDAINRSPISTSTKNIHPFLSKI